MVPFRASDQSRRSVDDPATQMPLAATFEQTVPDYQFWSIAGARSTSAQRCRGGCDSDFRNQNRRTRGDPLPVSAVVIYDK
jgi:hypothetical protein